MFDMNQGMRPLPIASEEERSLAENLMITATQAAFDEEGKQMVYVLPVPIAIALARHMLNWRRTGNATSPLFLLEPEKVMEWLNGTS